MFGKTSLIKLSPNKTCEGFIGAIFITLGWAILFVDLAFGYTSLTCQEKKFTMVLFEQKQCELSSAYMKQEFALPFEFMGYDYIWTSPA